jgi:nucleoside-diphosphate-sugar epimerase
VSNLTGRNVLITGGLGFIGSHLAARCVAEGTTVSIVDSMIPQYGGNLFNIRTLRDRVSMNISDIRDVHSLQYLVRGQDILFNLAGQTSHMDSMDDPYTDLDINARAQLALLETCRQYNPDIKIVFASTRQIYGKPDYLPVDEKHLLRPVDVNGVNKMAGEWYHILYNNVYGIRSCALRLTNTYGPHMRVKDARQTFLGIWVRLLVENQPFEVWGGQQLRDYNYVDDVVDAFVLAATNEQANGKIFNLGDKQVYSLADTARAMIDANGGVGEYSVRTFPDDRKKIDIGDYYSDYSYIQQELQWEPKTELATGMKQTLAFYQEHLNHYL